MFFQKKFPSEGFFVGERMFQFCTKSMSTQKKWVRILGASRITNLIHSRKRYKVDLGQPRILQKTMSKIYVSWLILTNNIFEQLDLEWHGLSLQTMTLTLMTLRILSLWILKPPILEPMMKPRQELSLRSTYLNQ